MIKAFADYLVVTVLRLDPVSPVGAALHFFVYDSVKILILLVVMISVIGFLRTYVAAEKIQRWVVGRGLIGNAAAAVFGALTPFCSCSSIPIFLGFLKAGVPLGVAFSFLLTSPLINEYLVVLMIGFFGWKITAAYVFCGLFIGIGAGAVLGRLRLEDQILPSMRPGISPAAASAQAYSMIGRVRYGLLEAMSILRGIWLWVLLGVAIGALIHGYVPESMIQSAIRHTGILSVPIAVIAGTPLYGSCASIVPVAVVLFQKGIPLGTALAFMMATSALSLPEAFLLKKALSGRLIATFFLVTVCGIVIIGYVFNALSVL
ncbi:MAG: permease [Candidatus Omnitrophica bacterium]|nr:permease [Candidatus Omnitrophota bacterium]